MMNIRLYSPSPLLKSSLFGLISAVMLGITVPANAQLQFYQELGGRESLRLDPDTIAILESIGLSLNPIVNTIEPAPGYSIGSLLLPPSSDPNVRGTTFVFGYDEEINLYFPAEGTEEFLGTFVFTVDQSQLNLEPQLAIGDFSNRFNSNFEFSLIDTASTGLKVLDVESPGIPTVDLDTQTWVLEGLNLYFSEEFSDYLIAAGAPQPIAGLRFAEARGNRSFVPVVSEPSESIPESSNIIALGLIGIIGVVARKVY